MAGADVVMVQFGVFEVAEAADPKEWVCGVAGTAEKVNLLDLLPFKIDFNVTC